MQCENHLYHEGLYRKAPPPAAKEFLVKGNKSGVEHLVAIAGAQNNKAVVVTNDTRMIKFMNSIGIPARTY